MNVSLQDVSLEDIKQQLQLLGQDVPDDLVRAYLQEVHEKSQAMASRVSYADCQQDGNTINSATETFETAENVPAHSDFADVQDFRIHEPPSESCAPSGDRRELEVCRQHGEYTSEGWDVGASMSTEKAAPGPREMAATASSTETSPRRQPYLPEQANENSVDICPTADSLDPALLLPADVLQRARSIINEHLAEHQMPPVESLSDFNVLDAPRPHVSQNRAAPLQNHSIGSSGRRPTRPEARDRPFQVPSKPEAHKIPHTAACGTRTQSKQKQRPSTASPASAAPNRRTSGFFTASGVDERENDVHGPDEVDDLMARLQKGARTRRSALESLEGSIFNSELGPGRRNARDIVKAHAKRRPATSGANRHSQYGSSQDATARTYPHMRRASSHGVVEDDEAVLHHGARREAPRAPSPERPHWRPPVKLNSSFLTGRSCLSGQARKVDRVARYQQLSKQWSRDRFLSTTSRRRNQGFQEAFAAAHDRSQADLDATKAFNCSDRPRTAGSRAYVPPGEKRRDQLRWDVRTRMQMQDDL